MSHFVALVIGDDVAGQLEPYSESLEMEEYEMGEVSVEERERCKDHYIEENPELKGKTFDYIYKKYGDDWNGGCWRKVGKVWKSFSTYNPDSKWDWWIVGGRWKGFLKLKEGAVGELGESGVFGNENKEGWADVVRKGDVDFAGMENYVREKAAKRYDKVFSVVGHLPESVTWEVMIENKGDKPIDVVRDEFWSQPRQVAWKEDKELSQSFFDSPDNYQMPREEYINKEVYSAYSPFAIVKDGIWYQKGRMGWWGMSTDEMPQSEWDKKVRDMLNDLPDDEMITVVDCHI